MRLIENIQRLKEETAKWRADGSPLLSWQGQQERWTVCKECDRLSKMGRCEECHCFMWAKTWMATVACPLRKWLPIHKSLWFFDSPSYVNALLEELVDLHGIKSINPVLFIRSTLFRVGAISLEDWPIEHAQDPKFFAECCRLVKIFGPGMAANPPMFGDIILSKTGQTAFYVGRTLVYHVTEKEGICPDHIKEIEIMKQLEGIYRVKS